MLSERDWLRGGRTNLGLGVIGVLLIVFGTPLEAWLGRDPTPFGFGLIGGAIAMQLLCLRKPSLAPSAAAKARLEQREPRLVRVVFAGFCVMTLSFLGFLGRDMGAIVLAGWQTVALTCVAGAGLLMAGLGTLPSLNKARLARLDPSLFDERDAAMTNHAYRRGFDAMFTAALFGGAAHMVFDVSFPQWAAFYGPALIGALAMQWQMVRACPSERAS